MDELWSKINGLLVWHKKGSSESLKSLINEEINEDKLFYEKIWIEITQIYWPSWPTMIVLILFSIILLVPSHLNWDIIVPGLYFRDDSHYQNLIAILAGISAIIFALIVFIAQQFNRDHKEASVLLKRSYLYPLLVLTIFSFFNFLWCDISVFSIIPIFFIGFFVIFSVSRLFNTLLSKYKFFKENLKFINDKFKRSIELAIDERVGNNLLLKKIEKMKIKYHFGSMRDKKSYYNFYSYKNGVIQDINLRKLNDFAEIVEKEAKKRGYSFYKDQVKPNYELGDVEESLSVGKKEFYIENKGRYLLKKYRERVDEDTILICIDKKLINDNEVIIKLKNKIKYIFVIKEGDGDFSNEIKLELREIKEQFIDAIKNENLGKIEDLYEVYPIFEEAFIKLLKDYGGNYTFEQAQEERGAIFGGWKEIKWLSNDIRDIFDIGMASHNRKIIEEIDYLPVFMARKALELDDHFLFQEFINFVIRLYWASQKEPDDKLKFNMVEKSWRYLKDTSSIIEFKLEETDLTKERLLSLKDFEIYLLIIFQSLLEEAKKNKDLNGFISFNNAANKLFTHFSDYQQYSKSIPELEWELGRPKRTEDEKNEIKNQIENKKTLENIEKGIKIRKYQMFFGLATWIFGNFKQNPDDYEEFYLEIEKSLPSDFKEFTEVFLSSHTFDADRFWGWIRWETFPEDRAITVDTMGKLERFYAIKSLKLLKNMSRKEIDKIDLRFKEGYNKDLAFLAKKEMFLKFLDSISQNPEEWKFILNQEEINCINTFKELLNRSEQIWQEMEKEKMRKGNISGKKVEKFKEEVLDGFDEWKYLRNIFNYFDLYEDRTDKIKPGMSRFGMNQIEDKALFFEEWHVEYPNWGHEYGRGIAIGETSDLLQKIVGSCEELQKIDFENKLERIDNVYELIILITGLKSSEFIRKSKEFRKKMHYEAPESDLDNSTDLGFIGYYTFEKENIPVFALFGTEIDKITILNKNKLGKLIQYSPLKEGENHDLIKNIFYMGIKVFSEDEKLINEFLGNSIDWLKEVGNKEEQKKHLEEKVWIQVLEKYEYKPDDEFEGYFIEFGDE